MGRLEKYPVISIIRDSSKGPVPYPYFAPPGEKCGLVFPTAGGITGRDVAD
jgi:hypothetical protein